MLRKYLSWINEDSRGRFTWNRDKSRFIWPHAPKASQTNMCWSKNIMTNRTTTPQANKHTNTTMSTCRSWAPDKSKYGGRERDRGAQTRGVSFRGSPKRHATLAFELPAANDVSLDSGGFAAIAVRLACANLPNLTDIMATIAVSLKANLDIRGCYTRPKSISGARCPPLLVHFVRDLGRRNTLD